MGRRRLLVTLSDSMYELVKQRAYFEGQSMSAVIREAIKNSVDPLHKDDQVRIPSGVKKQ